MMNLEIYVCEKVINKIPLYYSFERFAIVKGWPSASNDNFERERN